jgi:hypothetical protein
MTTLREDYLALARTAATGSAAERGRARWFMLEMKNEMTVQELISVEKERIELEAQIRRDRRSARTFLRQLLHLFRRTI